MPPVLQPVSWRILEEVRVTLAGMTAAAYFHPPKLAEVAVIEPPLLQYLDRLSDGQQVAYGVWMEDSDAFDLPTSLGKETVRARIIIQACKRFETTVQNPYEEVQAGVVTAGQIKEQLAHDVRKVVLKEWKTLGGDNLKNLVDDWQVVSAIPMFARHFEHSGWVGIEAETSIFYEFRKDDPTST